MNSNLFPFVRIVGGERINEETVKDIWMNLLGNGAQQNNSSATLIWKVVHPQSGQQKTHNQDKPCLEETCGQNGFFSGRGKVRHLWSSNQTPNKEKENQGLGARRERCVQGPVPLKDRIGPSFPDLQHSLVHFLGDVGGTWVSSTWRTRITFCSCFSVFKNTFIKWHIVKTQKGPSMRSKSPTHLWPQRNCFLPRHDLL